MHPGGGGRMCVGAQGPRAPARTTTRTSRSPLQAKPRSCSACGRSACPPRGGGRHQLQRSCCCSCCAFVTCVFKGRNGEHAAKPMGVGPCVACADHSATAVAAGCLLSTSCNCSSWLRTSRHPQQLSSFRWSFVCCNGGQLVSVWFFAPHNMINCLDETSVIVSQFRSDGPLSPLSRFILRRNERA